MACSLMFMTVLLLKGVTRMSCSAGPVVPCLAISLSTLLPFFSHVEAAASRARHCAAHSGLFIHLSIDMRMCVLFKTLVQALLNPQKSCQASSCSCKPVAAIHMINNSSASEEALVSLTWGCKTANSLALFAICSMTFSGSSNKQS